MEVGDHLDHRGEGGRDAVEEGDERDEAARAEVVVGHQADAEGETDDLTRVAGDFPGDGANRVRFAEQNVVGDAAALDLPHLLVHLPLHLVGFHLADAVHRFADGTEDVAGDLALEADRLFELVLEDEIAEELKGPDAEGDHAEEGVDAEEVGARDDERDRKGDEALNVGDDEVFGGLEVVPEDIHRLGAVPSLVVAEGKVLELIQHVAPQGVDDGLIQKRAKPRLQVGAQQAHGGEAGHGKQHPLKQGCGHVGEGVEEATKGFRGEDRDPGLTDLAEDDDDVHPGVPAHDQEVATEGSVAKKIEHATSGGVHAR